MLATTKVGGETLGLQHGFQLIFGHLVAKTGSVVESRCETPRFVALEQDTPIFRMPISVADEGVERQEPSPPFHCIGQAEGPT